MKIRIHGNKKSAELFAAARCVISVFIFAMLPNLRNNENMAQVTCLASSFITCKKNRFHADKFLFSHMVRL